LEVEGSNFIYETTLVGKISLGVHSYINPRSYVRNTRIGRYSSIANGVVLCPEQHSLKMISTHPFLISKSSQTESNNRNDETYVGNDVWVGTGVVIMPGVTIGDGAVIGASSVVTKDIPAYAIAVGAPAKVIRMRFPPSIVDALAELQWWNYSMDILQGFDLTNINETIRFIRTKIHDGEMRPVNLQTKTLICPLTVMANNVSVSYSRH
jgi:acetyltransferase-like isoleucine patch superfamily enzyme